MAEKIEMIGEYANKIFYKQESSFLIGNFIDKDGNHFKALGNMVNPQLGLTYKLTGEIETNAYGDQLKFSSFEAQIPKSTNGIHKYIVRICKFVGNTVGNAIVDKFGVDTLRIMKESPELVAKEIKGITLERAEAISNELLLNSDTEALMIELGVLLDVPGMRKNLAGELIGRFKSNAVEVLKENPYVLTSFHGIGFSLADRIALKNNYQHDHINRRKAACLHCIKEIMQSGNIWAPSIRLIEEMRDLIQVNGLEEALVILEDEEIIVSKRSCCENITLYTFTKAAEDEEYIAMKLCRLMEGSE